MTKIYRIPTGQVEGNSSNETNTSEIRPYGEIGLFIGDNNKLELLMFDGVRTHRRSKILNKGTFYGGDADSSDGAGLDTIKLIPDANQHFNDGSYGNDQYLIVEPTGGEPGHVHIRAGGTIDSSTADLFLGGELNNVRVSDTSNSVTISADANNNGATRNWIFDTNGILSVPAINNENLFIQGAEIGSTTSGIGITATNGITLTTDALGTAKFWQFGTDGTLTFPNGSTYDNNTLTGAVDSDLEFVVKHRTTVSDVAAAGSTTGTLIVDISANDDITVVGDGWEINAGSAIAPIWMSVTETTIDPGNTYEIVVPEFVFEPGNTYTFRNPTPTSKVWTIGSQNGTLIAPGGVILSSEYQAGNPNYRDFSIEMLEPGDAFEHRWVFRNDATLSIPGDIEFGDGTRQSTASSPQGEYIYEFDGINTNLTITEVNFNLLYCDPVDGYLGSDTHNINLPAGTPGQRLVVVNISSNCTLNVNGVAQVTALSGPAEFIYSPTDGSWITLYGTVVGV